MKKFLIIVPETGRQVLFPPPVLPRGFDFIVTTPDHDAGVVPVTGDGTAHPVEQGVLPLFAVRRVVPPLAAFEAVGLEVALVHDVQPVEVTQVEEARVRRVVRRADGVHVVLLEDQHIGEHVFRRQGAAALRVELVPVHAPDQHRAAIDHDVVAFGAAAAGFNPENDLNGILARNSVR